MRPIETSHRERRQKRRGNETALVKAAVDEDVEALRQQNEALESRLRQEEVRFQRQLQAKERHTQEDHADLTVEIVTALLPTLDSLQLATLMVEHDPRVRDGLLITWHELARTLERLGVRTHSPHKGDPFDPNVHEAVSYEAASAGQDGKILTTMREGYSLRGRLLRPALVVVTRAATGDVPHGGRKADL